MNTARPGPHNLHSLPTLTEVIELPVLAHQVATDRPAPLPAEQPMPIEAPLVQFAPVMEPAIDEEQVVERVLADLQRNADLLIEYRLRQTLTPALARLGDALISDVRDELVATLRDVVSQAVSQELARQRGR